VHCSVRFVSIDSVLAPPHPEERCGATRLEVGGPREWRRILYILRCADESYYVGTGAQLGLKLALRSTTQDSSAVTPRADDRPTIFFAAFFIDRACPSLHLSFGPTASAIDENAAEKISWTGRLLEV